MKQKYPELCIRGLQKQSNFYKLAIARKDKLTSFLRDKNFDDLANRPNITIYTGTASFICPDTVKVTLPDEEIELQGKEIFINTGSTSIIPAIDGIRDSKRVYTSSTLPIWNYFPNTSLL